MRVISPSASAFLIAWWTFNPHHHHRQSVRHDPKFNSFAFARLAGKKSQNTNRPLAVNEPENEVEANRTLYLLRPSTMFPTPVTNLSMKRFGIGWYASK